MNMKALWYSTYHLHIVENSMSPEQARALADKAVAAAPKSWWDRLFG